VARNYEVVFILKTLHNQRRQIENLEVEYATLQHWVVGLIRNNTSTNSNVRVSIGFTMEEVKEDETI